MSYGEPLMRIFVAGGTGVIGRVLVPMLVAAGHDVTGTTRSAEHAQRLTAQGARPVIVDVYDANALRSAVLAARPEVVAHQLTDLAGGFSPDDLARNARLRRIGTANLVAAAEAAGARRLIAQSIAWLYADGPLPHDETHPLRTPTDAPSDESLRGILELERLVLESGAFEGIVLRYGALYGPGSGADEADAPIPRVSVDGAARAALLAVEHGASGIYNVVDANDRVSNARARRELGWRP
jgi:nucleoside-diphosphate-sugar epimerase